MANVHADYGRSQNTVSVGTAVTTAPKVSMHDISNDEVMSGVDDNKKRRTGRPRKISQKKRHRSKKLRERMAMRSSMTGVVKVSSKSNSDSRTTDS